VHKTYSPQAVFGKTLISYFTEPNSAAGERKHVVKGQTDRWAFVTSSYVPDECTLWQRKCT